MYLAEFDNADIGRVLGELNLNMSKVRVGVYGTLRREGGANQLMDGTEFDCSVVIGDGTYMFDTGPFPFVMTGRRIRDRNIRRARGALLELYKLPEDDPDTMLQRLDTYEGVPHLYNRSYFLLNGFHEMETGKAVRSTRLIVYYTWAREVEENHELVPYGDWLLYKQGKDPYILNEKQQKKKKRIDPGLADAYRVFTGYRARPRREVNWEANPAEELDIDDGGFDEDEGEV